MSHRKWYQSLFFDQCYRLELIEQKGKSEVKLLQPGKLKMLEKPNSSTEYKEKLLTAWYREEIKRVIPSLLEKWQPVVGKTANRLGRKENENQMGELQYRSAPYLVEFKIS